MAPQKQHQSSHGRRTLQPNAKPKPPPLYRRGHSHSSVLSLSSHSSSGKSLLGGHKKSHTEIITSSEDEELGTASFLQFCATCEKQIVSPGSNILYCSEACREQDANSRLSHYERQPSSPAALTAARKPSSTYSEHHTPDILPRRSPTVLRPLSMTFSEISISENLADDDSPPPDSDPFGYEGPRDAFWHSHDNSHHDDNDRDHDANGLFSTSYSMLRPGNKHTRNSSEALPSLSHTPSSSVGTAASVHSNWQGRADTDSQLHQSQQQQHHHHHHQSHPSSQHHRHHHHHHHHDQQRQHQQHNQHNYPNQKPSRRTNRSVDLVTPCFLHTSTEDKDNDEFRDEDTQSSTETLTMMKGAHRRQDSHQFLAVTASETHQSERKRSGSKAGGQRREAGSGKKKT